MNNIIYTLKGTDKEYILSNDYTISELILFTGNIYLRQSIEEIVEVITARFKDNNEIIGCTIIYIDYTDYVIDSVYVRDDMRRLGVGTTIISYILKKYNTREQPLDILSVKNATPFWETMGFRVVLSEDDIDQMTYKR